MVLSPAVAPRKVYNCNVTISIKVTGVVTVQPAFGSSSMSNVKLQSLYCVYIDHCLEGCSGIISYMEGCSDTMIHHHSIIVYYNSVYYYIV